MVIPKRESNLFALELSSKITAEVKKKKKKEKKEKKIQKKAQSLNVEKQRAVLKVPCKT